jgi:hypothetical protein
MTNAQATKTVNNIQPAIITLHKAFDKANTVIFNNELPQVVLTMNPRGKSNSLGWFTVNPAWTNGNEEMHEINISPETLNRDYIEVIQTLIHEMLHLYNSVKGVKDTSRGNSYHNKKFLQSAIDHGFEYTHEAPDSKIGYSQITFTQKTINMIKFWNIDKSAFTIIRKEFGTGAKAKKPSNIIKWVCPGCGDIIRSSKPTIKAYCMNDEDGAKDACAVMFERETPEEEDAE